MTGGGPFEIAAHAGQLPAYLDLCADIGFDRVECGEGFTELTRRAGGHRCRWSPSAGSAVEFELGKKHDGAFDDRDGRRARRDGRRWLDDRRAQLVIEGRESAREVGLFDERGELQVAFAERFVEAFGFDATWSSRRRPRRASSRCSSTSGRRSGSSNVRLEELLRVEIYRRGLHSDAFATAPWRSGSASCRTCLRPSRSTSRRSARRRTARAPRSSRST